MGITVKLGIRALCEFVLQEGNIDSRFRGTERAADGTRIHKMLQKREGYQSEVHLKTEKSLNGILYRLDGRADGVFYKNDEAYIDEIKTTTVPSEFLTENFSKAHWAQGVCYASILCESENLNFVTVQLTYYQSDTAEIIRHEHKFAKNELSEILEALLELYEPWARRTESWRNIRNLSIKNSSFPFSDYRAGQYELARAVYRTAQANEILLASAPTGIGKTMSTLFPALKAVGEEHAERIFYLTSKTITRTAAENAIFVLRKNGILRIKSLTLTAKDKICFLEERNCTPEACPYARGYYDRVNKIILNLLENEDNFTREQIEKHAKANVLCPFELALDLSLWCDIITCDYNYLFDPVVSLKRFFEKEKGEYIFLIDEAHNLVDRARDMYSATLSMNQFYAVKKILGKGNKSVTASLKKINNLFVELKNKCEINCACVCEHSGKDLATLCEDFIKKTSKWLDENKEHEFHHDVLELYFSSRFYLKIFTLYNERYTTLLYKSYSDIQVKLFCIDPSEFIRSCLNIGQSSVLFSATLAPFFYFENTFGANNCKSISLHSPFPTENLLLLCAGKISTKYEDRESTLTPIADLIYTVITSKKGNYIVFFPSYKYMQQVYERFIEIYPHAEVLVQNCFMSEESREAFLSQFYDSGERLGFCVLGGIFSEGIDLTGNRLIGSIIIGVGLPQIGVEQNELRHYYDNIFGDGFAYAYQFPGFNKVMQAAGRVIRTPNDKGVVLLIDTRYCSSRYTKLFPRHWNNCKFVSNTIEVAKELTRFWHNNNI